jgi:hypothetical protein
MIAVYREDGKPNCGSIAKIVAGMRASFDFASVACGGCGAKGLLFFCCEYLRWLDFLEDGAPASAELALFRCKCGVCGKTHVVAPGEMVIPYMRHSLGFVLAALGAYARRERPVRQIAADFNIAVSTLYEWAARFRGHSGLLLGLLAAAFGGIEGRAETILGEPDLGRRLFVFAGAHGFCFMQAAKPPGAARCFALRVCLVSHSGASP